MTPTDTLREAVQIAINQAIDTHGEFATGAMATSALSAIEGAGWRIVPVQPTEAMLATQDKAHANAPTLKGQINDFCRTFASEIWAELLSAAPRLDATVRSGEEG